MNISRTIVDSLEGEFDSLKNIVSSGQRWKRIVRKASQNRVLYAFCKRIVNERTFVMDSKTVENMRKIVALGDLWRSKLRRTLSFIDMVLSEQGTPYLVAKTYRSIPYVTYDVDILVKPSDYQYVQLKLGESGELGKHPGKQAKDQINFFAPNLLTIDVHKGFSWQGSRYIEESIAWSNVRKEEIEGISCPIPSIDIEFLLEAAHILFERRYITLLDYLFIDRMLVVGVNEDLVREQVETFGWGDSFNALLEIFNMIASDFHDERNPYSDTQVHGHGFDMPFFVPTKFAFKIFLEKYHRTQYFPKWDFLYYLYTTTRYYISGKRRFPYYREWAPLEEIRW